MQVPQVVYPDRERLFGWARSGWHLKPKEPHIRGNVVFLTRGGVISYAESFLSFVEGYHLAEIVGEPTAGTNGNVNMLGLPGKYVIPFTGMKVVKHDGSQHQLIGIQPTIPLQRTLQAVEQGRDEYIEKALAVIKS
jgi:C-terminal processing protease CtpA/Prc